MKVYIYSIIKDIQIKVFILSIHFFFAGPSDKFSDFMMVDMSILW